MTTGSGAGAAFEVLPVGDEGLLVEVASLDDVLALDAALRRAVASGGPAWRDVTDVVPAARTVLLLTRERADLAALTRTVRELAATLAADGPGDLVRPPHGFGGVPGLATARRSHEVEIEVSYDGPDLVDVARLTGLSRAEVVAAHTGRPWRVAFGGFAPGFAYLVGGDARLVVPRRDQPRPAVPAGSVGLAGEFSGVYPRSSPGGWQLLGTTALVLWDEHRDPPALLTPGTSVRFVDVTGAP